MIRTGKMRTEEKRVWFDDLVYMYILIHIETFWPVAGFRLFTLCTVLLEYVFDLVVLCTNACKYKNAHRECTRMFLYVENSYVVISSIGFYLRNVCVETNEMKNRNTNRIEQNTKRELQKSWGHAKRDRIQMRFFARYICWKLHIATYKLFNLFTFVFNIATT